MQQTKATLQKFLHMHVSTVLHKMPTHYGCF